MSATGELSKSHSHSPLTRTVAIIKNHALQHRLDIEPRILAANFEIIKERQMEFDTDTDPETLVDLFGDDAASLAEGPVWVYVLERRRSVEVWLTLMGDPDPDIARENASSSLRALYGISISQNGLMGSPDVETAEVQIASLFASSPVYPSAELPLEDLVLSDEEEAVIHSFQRATSYATSGSEARSVLTDDTGNKKPAFKARPVPPTNIKPDISPRTTKAAALRAGAAYIDLKKPKKIAQTKEARIQAFLDVPGHKRSSTITVASTAPPTVAPRMTKSAALRQGIKFPERPKTSAKLVANKGSPSATFDGVPGHKRRESIAVSSTLAPLVAPRPNRSSSLRQQKDAAPPTSFMFRAPSAPKVPGRSSQPNSRAPSRAESEVPDQARPAIKARPSSVVQAPSIPVRPNKSAILRAAQKGGDEKLPPRRSVFI